MCRLIGAGERRQPLPQSLLRLFQALLFLIGFSSEIPLQPFRCILQGLVDLLRRGDNFHGCSQIASGAVGIAAMPPPLRARISAIRRARRSRWWWWACFILSREEY